MRWEWGKKVREGGMIGDWDCGGGGGWRGVQGGGVMSLTRKM